MTATEPPDPRAALAHVPCPWCKGQLLDVEFRPELRVREVGTYSVAGVQPKLAAETVAWPWLVCRTQDCPFEQRGSLATEADG